MEACFICKKHRDAAAQSDVIYEDDYVRASLMTARAEERLAYLGYAVVETKRHAPGLGDLNAEEARAVGETMNRVSAALKETQSAEHVYAFVQGDGVPHFHIHLVPRYAGTPPEYRHPMNLVHWPDAKRGGHEALQGIREALQARLHGS